MSGCVDLKTLVLTRVDLSVVRIYIVMSQEHRRTDPQYPIERHLLGNMPCTPECSVQTSTFPESHFKNGYRLDFRQQALDVCPCFSLKQIENIDACLGFLAAKGVNIKGLCAEGELTN